MSKSKRKIKSHLSKYRRSSGDIPAKMGNYANQLYVPNRANYIYVRLQDGTVIDVYNVRVTPKLGLEVWIGYLEKEPHLLQVVSARNGQARYGDTGNPYLTVQPHHLTHEWMASGGGNDVTFIQLRQFMPLRPTPLGGMTLGIYRGVGRLGSSWTYFSGSSVDLSPYIPSTGSLFALVYESSTGIPAVIAGTVRDTNTLSLSDIPAPINGTLPIAAVRLYGGQTGIVEARTSTDLIDLRFPLWQGGTSSVSTGTSGSSAWSDITGKPSFFPAQIAIYDNGTFKATGTAIDFGNNLDVSVTGTTIFVNVSDQTSTGTFYSPYAPFDLTPSDGAWCWFGDPRAVYYNGNTFFGYVSSTGTVIARSFNHTTKAITSASVIKQFNEIDDHDNPTFLIRDSDKRIMVWYNKHNGTNAYMRISTNPEDVSSWGAEVDLDASIGASTYDYPNPIQLLGEANHPIYLIYRHSYFGQANERRLLVTKSLDDGSTWAAGTDIYTPGGTKIVYFKTAQNGSDRIDFAVTDGHPSYTASVSIYHFYYQGGNYYKSDGTLISAGLPLGPSDLTKVYDGATNRSWIWDIAIDSSGKPVIVFAKFIGTSTTDAHYMYANWTGSAWIVNEIIQAGGPGIGSDIGEDYYSGGIVLDHSNPNIVYLSKQVNGQWEMYKGITPDAGATWILSAITGGSSVKNVRPFVVRNHPSGYSALYLAGTYVTAANYSMKIKYVYDDVEASAGGAGDMLKSVYDTDNDGVVDNSETLNGHADTYFATAGHTHTSSGKYQQYIHIVSGGDFGFVIDINGNPITALFDLE